jgi:hypothetical protein
MYCFFVARNIYCVDKYCIFIKDIVFYWKNTRHGLSIGTAAVSCLEMETPGFVEEDPDPWIASLHAPVLSQPGRASACFSGMDDRLSPDPANPVGLPRS